MTAGDPSDARATNGPAANAAGPHPGRAATPGALQSVDAAPPSSWARIKQVVRQLGPAGPLAVMASTFPAIGGLILLGFIQSLGPWLASDRMRGLIIYIACFAGSAALSLLPTYACSILGGYAFGFWGGWIAAMVSFTAASFIAWIVNSAVAGDRVVNLIADHPRWEAIRRALVGSGFVRSFWILTLARVPPTSPFALMNFIVATTRAPLGAWLLATLVGMAPRTAAVVWAASHARTINVRNTTSVTVYLLWLGLTLVVVAVIGHIANKAIHTATRDPAQAST